MLATRRLILDNPDLAMFMIALRTELHTRIVIPAVLPGSPADVLSLARFEAGDRSGNPHFHGLSYAKGKPRVGWVRATEDEKADKEREGQEPEGK